MRESAHSSPINHQDKIYDFALFFEAKILGSNNQVFDQIINYEYVFQIVRFLEVIFYTEQLVDTLILANEPHTISQILFYATSLAMVKFLTSYGLEHNTDLLYHRVVITLFRYVWPVRRNV